MKKLLRSMIIFVLVFSSVYMPNMSSLAADTIEAPQKSDMELINDYLDNLGYKTITKDLIASMQEDTSRGKSEWDMLVEYVKTGECPDGIQITIDDGSI